MPHRRLTARVRLWLPPIVYMAVIFYVSSQPDPLPDLTAHVWDKALHAIEYAGLAALLGRALLGEGLGPVTSFAAALLLAAVYGATDEYHQSSVPLRNADVQDWAVDVIGGCLGAIGYITFITHMRGPSSGRSIRLKPDPTDRSSPADRSSPTDRSSTL